MWDRRRGRAGKRQALPLATSARGPPHNLRLMTSLHSAIAAALPYAKWGSLLYVLFCVWITRCIVRRWGREAAGKGRKSGDSGVARWFGYFLVFFLLSGLSMAALTMPLAIGERASIFVTGDEQMATVVSVSSREERVTREDSDGRNTTVMVTMFTPVYRFTLPGDDVRERAGDVSSESEPTVGDRQKIFYDAQRDRLVTASISNVMMLCAGAMFSFFFVLGFYATLRYAFGRSTQGAMQLMGAALMNGVIPVAMGLMAVGLGVYAYERFTTDWHDDDPVFVAGLCAFFAVTLLFVVVAWVRARLVPGAGQARARTGQ